MGVDEKLMGVEMIDPRNTLKTKAEKEGEVDRVYRLVKSWLLECKLAPGEFLAEVEVARRCETSRTPVREACSRLAQDGWISRIPHKGYQVSPVSIRGLLQNYEYRKVLECFTAEHSVHLATTAQLDALGQIIAIENDRDADVSQVIPASDLFHMGIAEIAGNQHVISQLKLTLEYQRRLDRLSAQKDTGWIPHGDILAALQSRRPNEARWAMATHIDFARDRMLKLFAT